MTITSMKKLFLLCLMAFNIISAYAMESKDRGEGRSVFVFSKRYGPVSQTISVPCSYFKPGTTNQELDDAYGFMQLQIIETFFGLYKQGDYDLVAIMEVLELFDPVLSNKIIKRLENNIWEHMADNLIGIDKLTNSLGLATFGRSLSGIQGFRSFVITRLFSLLEKKLRDPREDIIKGKIFRLARKEKAFNTQREQEIRYEKEREKKREENFMLRLKFTLLVGIIIQKYLAGISQDTIKSFIEELKNTPYYTLLSDLIHYVEHVVPNITQEDNSNLAQDDKNEATSCYSDNVDKLFGHGLEEAINSAQQNHQQDVASYALPYSIRPWKASVIRFLKKHPRLHVAATAATGFAATLAWCVPYFWMNDSLTKTNIAGIIGAGAATTGLLYCCKEQLLPKKLLGNRAKPWTPLKELAALTAGTAVALGATIGFNYLDLNCIQKCMNNRT